MPSRKALLPILFLVSAAMAHPAPAASPDAWAAFRRDVEASCRAAGAALIENPAVTVDPFGSESYGLAFLTGKAVEDGSDRSLVCIYDKVSRKSEIGGAMALQKPEAPSVISGGAPAAPTPAPPAAPAESEAAAPPASAAPTPETSVPPGNPDADAALADRFAAFPDDPPEPSAPAGPEEAPATDPEPPVSPQNQRVVTPPVPILPNVPAPGATAGQAATPDDAGENEGAPPEGPAAAGEAATGAPENAAASRFAGCDAACAATLAAVAEPDQRALADLPFEIERTIARNADANLAAGPGAARTAAGLIAANLTGRPSGEIAAPTDALLGERSCVLYYFGYSNQAARTVARHRCAVTAGENGALTVAKTSGEQLRAELKPLTPGVSAFVGRTFKAGQAANVYDPLKPVSDTDADLGNSVGLATASDGRLMLVSSELRRFEGEDNFFWVLAIDPK